MVTNQIYMMQVMTISTSQSCDHTIAVQTYPKLFYIMSKGVAEYVVCLGVSAESDDCQVVALGILQTVNFRLVFNKSV